MSRETRTPVHAEKASYADPPPPNRQPHRAALGPLGCPVDGKRMEVADKPVPSPLSGSGTPGGEAGVGMQNHLKAGTRAMQACGMACQPCSAGERSPGASGRRYRGPRALRRHALLRHPARASDTSTPSCGLRRVSVMRSRMVPSRCSSSTPLSGCSTARTICRLRQQRQAGEQRALLRRLNEAHVYHSLQSLAAAVTNGNARGSRPW